MLKYYKLFESKEAEVGYFFKLLRWLALAMFGLLTALLASGGLSNVFSHPGNLGTVLLSIMGGLLVIFAVSHYMVNKTMTAERVRERRLLVNRFNRMIATHDPSDPVNGELVREALAMVDSDIMPLRIAGAKYISQLGIPYLTAVLLDCEDQTVRSIASTALAGQKVSPVKYVGTAPEGEKIISVG